MGAPSMDLIWQQRERERENGSFNRWVDDLFDNEEN